MGDISQEEVDTEREVVQATEKADDATDTAASSSQKEKRGGGGSPLLPQPGRQED